MIDTLKVRSTFFPFALVAVTDFAVPGSSAAGREGERALRLVDLIALGGNSGLSDFAVSVTVLSITSS